MPAALPQIATQQLIDGLAAGHTQGHVADLIGTGRETVNRYAKKLKAEIEARALEYFAHIPKATKLNLDCLDMADNAYQTAKTIDKPLDRAALLQANSTLLGQAHKIADRMLQSVGIAPSLAPSVVVQQFVQVNNSTLIAPNLAGMFAPESIASLSEPDSMDAEFTELEDVTGDTDA